MKTKIIISGLILGFLGISNLNSSNITKINTGNFISTDNANISDLPDFVKAAEMSIPAVVHIKTTFQKKNDFYDDFFSPFYDFFNMQSNSSAPVQGAGSGVIVSSDGYIVTNNHVVQDAQLVSVTLNDKREYQAEIIGTDPETDLALIKINETDLPFLVFGNSDEVKVGEWVLAVGNPFNLTSTVTAGIVSAKARNINILGEKSSVESFIQTDAAVNRGNSGGALVDTDGKLIGINAAIASTTGAYSGYSFAIPSNIAHKVINDLMEYGVVQRAYLGLTMMEVDANVAKRFGIKDIKGLYISEVAADGAAYSAGIDAGDIIIAINGEIINSTSRFNEILAEKHPGDKIVLDLKKNDKTIKKTIVLQNRRGDTELIKLEDRNIVSVLGATFEELSKDEKKKMHLTNGIKIIKLDNGTLRRAGVQEGFIITKINSQLIETIDDIEKYLTGKTGGVLIEGCYPNGMKAYYGFGI